LEEVSQYKKKWLTELSVIGQVFSNPVIAITGTVGKTTVTHALSHILKTGNRSIWTGGNIGKPMLDLLREKQKIDLALLEVSSFQLEHVNFFRPTLAIWTNFYPNHLDRHKNTENYFNAKKNIIDNQKEGQFALLPFQLRDKIKRKNISFFQVLKPPAKELKKLIGHREIFYIEKNSVVRFCVETEKKEIIFSNLERFTNSFFSENLLILFSALNILYRIKALSDKNLLSEKQLSFLPPIKHRLEKIEVINNIVFYNDSKSTTSASTIAAVKKLSTKPIILLLGGLSKGVSRRELIRTVKKNVTVICTFGAESKKIAEFCRKEKIACRPFSNLDSAVKESFKLAQPGDQILLSPAGSSFDQFKNYEHRGNQFRKLVTLLSKPLS